MSALEFSGIELLKGDLTGFSYSSTSQTFLFNFGNIAGDAAGIYSADGNNGITIVKTGFSGDFASSFSSNVAKANTGLISVVPEPSTYLLFGLGLLMVVTFVSRSSKKKA